MATNLYLDTARLGRMSLKAQLAHIDFIRLAGEEAGSLYFDEFLKQGCHAWPDSLQGRYSALDSWGGVSTLKRDLKRLAGAAGDSRLLLANRSFQLMRFAARLLFGPCRNVLVTDLSWPNYQQILSQQARRSGNTVTRLNLRRWILQGRLPVEEVVQTVVESFLRHRCDGLFLPYVDNLGVRLPIREIVDELRARAELRFVVVDGAQTFGHVPFRLADDFCDFFLAGCHKWLRAHNPLGLGFYGHRRSRDYIDATLQRMLSNGRLNDPLLAFTEQLESGRLSAFTETVNLTPLFSCRGAVDDLLHDALPIREAFNRREENGKTVADVIKDMGWNVLRPSPGLRSGIVLMEPADHRLKSLGPDCLRRRFLQRGIAVSTYEGGKVRLSMPDAPWQFKQLETLRWALTRQSPLRPSTVR